MITLGLHLSFDHQIIEKEIRCQFHQRFMCNFCARQAQKRKKDSQVVSLFTLSGSARAKAVRKYVREIDPKIMDTVR
jgi:hypothetical protein